jgi:hypothetical protein
MGQRQLQELPFLPIIPAGELSTSDSALESGGLLPSAVLSSSMSVLFLFAALPCSTDQEAMGCLTSCGELVSCWRGGWARTPSQTEALKR